MNVGSLVVLEFIFCVSSIFTLKKGSGLKMSLWKDLLQRYITWTVNFDVKLWQWNFRLSFVVSHSKQQASLAPPNGAPNFRIKTNKKKRWKSMNDTTSAINSIVKGFIKIISLKVSAFCEDVFPPAFVSKPNKNWNFCAKFSLSHSSGSVLRHF